VIFGERLFDIADPDDDGAVMAFVVVARDQLGDASDLIAFGARGGVAPWLGREPLLGAQRVLAPRLGEPLRVFPNVLKWLAGGRDGVVVLNWRRAAERLAGLTLAVVDVEFGQVLRDRLTRPAPSIVVERQSEAAA
jgi:hypothetical protein